MDIDTDALAENFRRLSQSIRNRNEDKKMYTIDTDIINGYDNGQQITEQAYEMLLGKGCPESWFEEIEGFEKGKYYFFEGSIFDYVVRCNGKFTDERVYGQHYPLSNKIGSFNEERGGNRSQYIRPATDDEIEQALTAEAKRRGLIDNKYKILQSGGIEVEGSIDEINYMQSVDKLWIGYNNGYLGVAYYKGNWAEPIDTNPDIEINGYKAEFHDDYVQFGCAKIDKKFFTEMYIHDNDAWDYTGEGNRSVTGIRWGAGIFTTEDIKQIAKYYQ